MVLQGHIHYQSEIWTTTRGKAWSTTGSATWTMEASTSQPKYPSTPWRSSSSITPVCVPSKGSSLHFSLLRSWKAEFVALFQVNQMDCAQSWWSPVSPGRRRNPGGRTSGRSPASPWSWSAGSELDSSEKSGWVSCFPFAWDLICVFRKKCSADTSHTKMPGLVGS